MAKRLSVLGCGALAVASLAACSSGTSTSGAASSAASGCPVTVSDAWVKAADSGMTGVFGTLSNPTAQPVTVSAASASIASSAELHETLNGVMQPAAGGFAVPATGNLVLSPGADHIMLMGLTAPVVAGQDVTVNLTCTNGAQTSFVAQAKTYAGAAESYAPHGSSMPPSASASMSSMG